MRQVGLPSGAASAVDWTADCAECQQQSCLMRSSCRWPASATLYPAFELQDVLNHRAVIVFPYQSSTMMLTELYRANVPIARTHRSIPAGVGHRLPLLV